MAASSNTQTVVEQFASILRRRCAVCFSILTPELTRHRQLVGARLTALHTVNVLRQVVATAQFATIEELIDLLKTVGQQLHDAQPKGKCTSRSHRNNEFR